MWINRSEKYIHLDLYLTIEDDLKTLARYVDFDKDNDNVFSIELARILLIASSEVDVVLKLLCKELKSNWEYKNINDYRMVIQESLKSLINEKVYSIRYWLELTPFINWDNQKWENPDWWKAYNKVKHNRDENFKKANLKNTLNSVAWLLVVLNYYYLLKISWWSDISKFKDIFHELWNKWYKSKIFKLSEEYYYYNLVV